MAVGLVAVVHRVLGLAGLGRLLDDRQVGGRVGCLVGWATVVQKVVEQLARRTRAASPALHVGMHAC